MGSNTNTRLSPFASPSTGALLKKKIIAWSLETGLPASVHVHAGGKIFDLHKLPLISKSGYFNKALLNSADVELPKNFPGGSETFEIIALFCYNALLPFDPFNVTALRCASNFLEMTENYSGSNLCERSDLYINQVVLQSWDDTLIVLQKCQALLPYAEELLIVCRCVESLAFMACMEILDPDNNRDCELWIKDLIALPFEFFKRIISSLRRQGMKEKYVSPLIVFYAKKWIISKKTQKYLDANEDVNNNKISEILHGILDLLPMGEKGCMIIPVSFYFSLLSRSMTLNLSNECVMRLQDQVISLLHLARVEDFLLPEKCTESITSTPEFEVMEKIISTHVSNPLSDGTSVADLWDQYLSQIATDPNLEPGRFMELIEIIPMSNRETHDHLYRALNTFLLEHPNLSSEEKASVCKYLTCQKLSQEICIDAVQNELMPLRLIVQALFVQQLHTHQTFKECSNSFRYTQCGEFSGSLSRSQNLEESPFNQMHNSNLPLSLILRKDRSTERSELGKEEYDSTSFRLQALECELISLKRSLGQQNVDKVDSFRLIKKKKSIGQVNSCINVSWASQRKFASRILKIFKLMTTSGKGKLKKKKEAASGKTFHQMYNC